MSSYPVPKSYPNNSIDGTFNIDDFTYMSGYASLADLINYANLTFSNVFTQTNFFTSIYFANNLNGISATNFQWINNLATYFYDSDTGDVAIGSNLALGGSLAVIDVNCTNLVNQSITTNNITTQNITCRTLTCNNLVSVYLFSNGLMYPLIQSGNIVNLTNLQFMNGSNTVPLYITIAPSTTFLLQDSNNVVLYKISNSTDDFIHYQEILFNSFFTPTKYQIFH